MIGSAPRFLPNLQLVKKRVDVSKGSRLSVSKNSIKVASREDLSYRCNLGSQQRDSCLYILCCFLPCSASSLDKLIPGTYSFESAPVIGGSFNFHILLRNFWLAVLVAPSSGSPIRCLLYCLPDKPMEESSTWELKRPPLAMGSTPPCSYFEIGENTRCPETRSCGVVIRESSCFPSKDGRERQCPCDYCLGLKVRC